MNEGDKSDKIGEVFCKFYTKWMEHAFRKIVSKVYLKFEKNEKCDVGRICEGEHDSWKDSRPAFDNKELKAKFVFFLNAEPEETVKTSDLKPFLEFVIKEIEKVFKDLLYLEAVEERIEKMEGGREQDKRAQIHYKDRLVNELIGNLLDREWLTVQYVKKTLKEQKLPEVDLLIQISAQKYEQRLVTTKMFFYAQGNEIPGNRLQFDPELDASREDRQIKQKNLRTIRKMMEMAGKDHGLVICCENGKFYIDGVMRDPKEIEVPTIEFMGHLKWKLRNKEGAIFTYYEGEFQIPALDGEGQDDDLEIKLVRLQKYIPELDKESVKEIVEELKGQGHGTSIVFMDQGTLDFEKERLGKHKRLYNMCAFSLLDYREEVIGISSIDGAILADVEGKCHAVGAILDGESSIEADAGRGARYNSVANYVNVVLEKYLHKAAIEPEKRWCFAVVLSEDKMVSVVAPKLYKLE